MKLYKRLLAVLFSIIMILSFSASCFGVVFVPVTPQVDGLPAYTLTESFVNETKTFLENGKSKIIKNGIHDSDAIMAWNDFSNAYLEVATQANVAYVLYASDMSSQTYKNNYLFATKSYNDVYALYMKALQEIDKHEKENNVSKDDSMFNDMSEKDMARIRNHTEEVSKLENDVTELQVEYAELTEEEFYNGAVEIYKQIIVKNNQIATAYGCENYYEYASEYVYNRDYTSNQLSSFRRNVGQALPSLITTLNSNLSLFKENLTDGAKNALNGITSSKYDTTKINYWNKYVESYNGTDTKIHLTHAFEHKNVMFADGANSNQGAFTAYLPSYDKNFCYFGPNYQDVFTVSHEIGHYYASLFQEQGTTSMDLNEIHSQGNEMLLLEFLSGELDQSSFKCLELSKLLTILSTTFISTIVDEFEYYVYTNSSAMQSYTSADFDAKMNEICQNYGGIEFVNSIGNGFNINDYWRKVVVEHPVYYLSYATSGIASVSLYLEADASRSEARKIYTKLVEQKSDSLGFVGCLVSAGLSSPFTSETFEDIKSFINNREQGHPSESESESSVEHETTSESESCEESTSTSNEESDLAA